MSDLCFQRFSVSDFRTIPLGLISQFLFCVIAAFPISGLDFDRCAAKPIAQNQELIHFLNAGETLHDLAGRSDLRPC